MEIHRMKILIGESQEGRFSELVAGLEQRGNLVTLIEDSAMLIEALNTSDPFGLVIIDGDLFGESENIEDWVQHVRENQDLSVPIVVVSDEHLMHALELSIAVFVPRMVTDPGDSLYEFIAKVAG
jgi:DNA-binding response OmpR family regulator